MRIKNLVEEMGGVARFTSEPLAPTLRETMSEFLDITREEFADYLDYLELYGGETGLIKEYRLTPYSNLPEYCYPDDAIPPVGGNIAWGGGGLGFFIAPVKGGGQLSPMSERLKIYKNISPIFILLVSVWLFAAPLIPYTGLFFSMLLSQSAIAVKQTPKNTINPINNK